MSEITIKDLEKRISRLENQSKPNNNCWPTREEILEIALEKLIDKNKKLEETNRFLRNENKEITLNFNSPIYGIDDFENKVIEILNK